MAKIHSQPKAYESRHNQQESPIDVAHVMALPNCFPMAFFWEAFSVNILFPLPNFILPILKHGQRSGVDTDGQV